MRSEGHRLSWRRAISALSIVVILFSACLPDAKMKIAYNDRPRQRNDGWILSTPKAEGLDPRRLDAVYRDFFDEDLFVTAISLLVVRHGKLVAEGYCRDLEDIDRLNAIQSATKSFTSLLTGMVIDDGLLEGVEQRIYDVIPDKFDSDAKKRVLTVQDLLTMRSGIDFPNEDFSRELLIDGQPDSLAYILRKPQIATPGTKFDYIDASPHLLAGVLQRVIGTSLEQYAGERLFGPLGIRKTLWERYPDGVTYGAVGLYLTPRALAKVGLFMLQQGVWEGRLLLSSEWITESTSSTTRTDFTTKYGYRYGYYWWTLDDLGAFSADGHGGQFVFVVRDLDLVIVMTAEPHTKNDAAAIELPEFTPLAQRIMRAVVD